MQVQNDKHQKNAKMANDSRDLAQLKDIHKAIKGQSGSGGPKRRNNKSVQFQIDAKDERITPRQQR